ncbi:alpha/beta fold hydrolase [Amycolatopsis plumensis]|uniref:Alpha/beta fold hydrolase n=1 Tax=Amycolatopsis plumensis TaxID=236508 RepID=A0ABV5TZD6_9PSEU
MCDAVGWLGWGHGGDRGALGDRRVWDAQFTALAATHRVIRYDRRGFGETRGETGEHAHYEDLPALLDARGIEQAALVGASLGGACRWTPPSPRRSGSPGWCCSVRA